MSKLLIRRSALDGRLIAPGTTQLNPEKPVFTKAHVRFFGAFSEADRIRMAKMPDVGGNLVVTIRDDRIEVGFDQQDVVYTVPIASGARLREMLTPTLSYVEDRVDWAADANAIGADIERETMRSIAEMQRARMEANEAVLKSWIENGRKGVIWQNGPMGEIWIDDSFGDETFPAIIHQHPEGMMERFRGTRPPDTGLSPKEW